MPLKFKLTRAAETKPPNYVPVFVPRPTAFAHKTDNTELIGVNVSHDHDLADFSYGYGFYWGCSRCLGKKARELEESWKRAGWNFSHWMMADAE